MSDDATTSDSPASTPKPPAKSSDDTDLELKAINVVVTALTGLTEEQRLRALDYILRRFKAINLQTQTAPLPLALPPDVAGISQVHAPGPRAIRDIRTLKESKAPKSANEMAALVAYYVSELAPEGERKQEITSADIERYFKMGNFTLPADAGFTLVNAKNAGYLESAGRGQYRLNPVGYNLVVHRMDNRSGETSSRGKTKAARKRVSKPRAQK
jgi:hypothetical protein